MKFLSKKIRESTRELLISLVIYKSDVGSKLDF